MNEKTFLYIVISFVIIAFFVCIGYSVLEYTRGIESELERSKNTIAELELVAEQSRERLDREAKLLSTLEQSLNEKERALTEREMNLIERESFLMQIESDLMTTKSLIADLQNSLTKPRPH